MSLPPDISERTAKFLGLNYKECANGDLFCYSDADWAGDWDDRHSTSGNVFSLAGGAVNLF